MNFQISRKFKKAQEALASKKNALQNQTVQVVRTQVQSFHCSRARLGINKPRP